MGLSVVATVVGGVIVGASWCITGGIAMPTVSLQEVGTSDVVSLIYYCAFVSYALL